MISSPRLLNSIVPDANLTMPQLSGLTKLERVKAIAGLRYRQGAFSSCCQTVTDVVDGLLSLHHLDDAERDLLEYRCRTS